jgi:hypothetical protein
MFLLPLIASSQSLIIKDEQYVTFDGRNVNVWLIEGDKVVLNIDKSIINQSQKSDLTTLTKILIRTDSLYKFYLNSFGEEPPGGNSRYSNKCDVFFGAPSCGSGCGAIGSKGIEVSGFNEIYYNLKFNTNVNRDVIIGYEFGRNFFTFSDRVLFPYDASDIKARNGGFAEGFASMMYLFAFDSIIKNQDERDLNETFQNIKWNLKQFRGYINDTTATPYNSLARWDKFGVLDPNRGLDGWNYDEYAAYPGASILMGIFDTFGKENLFPGFYKKLKLLPKVTTIEDALSNIALATSQSLNKNLNAYFENVLKFKINPSVKNQISTFATIQSKLIKDESVLWFLSPFEKINLNLRSTNYISDRLKYRLIIDNKIYSETLNGNNSLSYELLKGNSSLIVKCQLVDGQTIVDEFSTTLKKRDKVDLVQNNSDLYSYYLANATTKSVISADNKVIMSNLEKSNIDYGVIFYNLNFSRNRLYKMEGEINVSFSDKVDNPNYKVGGLSSKGYAGISFSGPGRKNGTQRVGYDVGKGDTLNYFKVSFSDSSNLFMPKDRKYFMNRIGLSSDGYGIISKFKNLYFYDITDTDKDGIIDFEDDCPITANPPKPTITIESNGALTSSASDGNQWYFNDIKIDNATQKTINPTKSGNYTVKIITPCASEISKPYNLVITSTEETILEQVQLSPNPFLSQFKVSFPIEFGKTAQVKIVDISGNVQFNKASVIDGEQIDLAKLNHGNYILHLISNDNMNSKSIKISKIQ